MTNRKAPPARDRIRSRRAGVMIAPTLMSRIITPSPAPNSEREDERQDDRHRHAGAGERDEEQRHREDHAAERVGRPESDPPADPRRDTAPITPPIAPDPSASPRRPGSTPRVVVAYRMNSAAKAKLKRLIVAAARRVGRMIGSRRMNEQAGEQPLAQVDLPRASTGGSGDSIRRRKTTEPRYDSGVGQHRQRRPEDLDQQAADRRPADLRERPAAVEQRHRLDVALALRDRHEAACSTTGRTATASDPVRKPTTYSWASSGRRAR